MNTPFTDKKLKEFDENEYVVTVKELVPVTHEVIRAFLTQAMNEDQQETAREIPGEVENAIFDGDAHSFPDLASVAYREGLANLASLITSKYLSREGETKNFEA